MTPIANKTLHPNLIKFLMLITFCEGTDRQNTPYNELFGFTNFTGYEKHPNILIKSRNYRSTAAGRYQILWETWKYLKGKFKNLTFSPADQDTMAVILIREQRAYDLVIAGKWEQAIAKTNDCWASLPGSPYGQPVRSLPECLKFINSIKL
jgi:lysozyme